MIENFFTERPYVAFSSNGVGYEKLYPSVSCKFLLYGLDSNGWYSDSSFSYDTSRSIADFDSLVWTNFDVLNEDDEIAFYGSMPVDPNGATGSGGFIHIESSQVLDDSASFVLSITDLTDESSVYTVKASRFIDVELESETVSKPFAGPSMSLHLTAANLIPETEYEFVFTLQYNGEDTEIQTSTTVTTLAGEGEVLPDYSGQLGGIQDSIDDMQQGIGEVKDSVDGVGETLEGVQDTLTETKEEISPVCRKRSLRLFQTA